MFALALAAVAHGGADGLAVAGMVAGMQAATALSLSATTSEVERLGCTSRATIGCDLDDGLGAAALLGAAIGAPLGAVLGARMVDRDATRAVVLVLATEATAGFVAALAATSPSAGPDAMAWPIGLGITLSPVMAAVALGTEPHDRRRVSLRADLGSGSGGLSVAGTW